jgi:GT2 family glycosyltransferase
MRPTISVIIPTYYRNEFLPKSIESTLSQSHDDTEIVVNHGDRCEAFAETLDGEGYRAQAPEIGETVTI